MCLLQCKPPVGGQKLAPKLLSQVNFSSKKDENMIGKRFTFMKKKKKLVHFEIFLPFVSLLHLKSLDLLSMFYV